MTFLMKPQLVDTFVNRFALYFDGQAHQIEVLLFDTV
jgi:hypothetical protein